MKKKIKFDSFMYLTTVSIIYLVVGIFAVFYLPATPSKLFDDAIMFWQTLYIVVLVFGLVIRDFILPRINHNRI